MDPNDSLHQAVATALGWTLEETKSTSLRSLRELVQRTHPKLALELKVAILAGAGAK